MKKVIRLTESDLVRIVKRVMNEGVKATLVGKLKDINGVEPGDTFKGSTQEMTWMSNGKQAGLFNDFKIIQNPRQVQMGQSGAMNVKSFDPNTKMITFDNGLVIGPL
jgi:hypothetical protein